MLFLEIAYHDQGEIYSRSQEYSDGVSHEILISSYTVNILPSDMQSVGISTSSFRMKLMLKNMKYLMAKT